MAAARSVIPRRRVLVLAYFFPPLGGAGVQRTLKFAKYLPARGWDPVVVTTRSHWYPAKDPTLLAEIPRGTPVYRASDPPPLRLLAMALDRFANDPARLVAAWPDDQLAWAPGAFVSALRAIKRHRPDVLLSTSAPYTGHLVGLALQRRTGLPWVADFRDEWASNPGRVDEPAPLAALTRAAEKAVADAAARVVVAADFYDVAGAPRGARKRVEITNGVDEDDLPALTPPQRGDRFRLTLVGTLYEGQDGLPALRAIRRLIDRGDVDAARFELRIVGNIWLREDELADAPPFTHVGYADHATALQEMQDASALLYYDSATSRAQPAKLFEYLASERPLVAIGRAEKLAGRLAREWRLGTWAEPDDDAAIEQAILSMWRRWEADDLPDLAGTRQRVLERYSRRVLADRLADVLDDVASADA